MSLPKSAALPQTWPFARGSSGAVGALSEASRQGRWPICAIFVSRVCSRSQRGPRQRARRRRSSVYASPRPSGTVLPQLA
eukprot:11022938-Lingulodinium_polyedra.AAC.1